MGDTFEDFAAEYTIWTFEILKRGADGVIRPQAPTYGTRWWKGKLVQGVESLPADVDPPPHTIEHPESMAHRAFVAAPDCDGYQRDPKTGDRVIDPATGNALACVDPTHYIKIAAWTEKRPGDRASFGWCRGELVWPHDWILKNPDGTISHIADQDMRKRMIDGELSMTPAGPIPFHDAMAKVTAALDAAGVHTHEQGVVVWNRAPAKDGGQCWHAVGWTLTHPNTHAHFAPVAAHNNHPDTPQEAKKKTGVRTVLATPDHPHLQPFHDALGAGTVGHIDALVIHRECQDCEQLMIGDEPEPGINHCSDCRPQ